MPIKITRTSKPHKITGAYVRVVGSRRKAGGWRDSWLKAAVWARDVATAERLVFKAMGRKLRKGETMQVEADLSKRADAFLLTRGMTKGRAHVFLSDVFIDAPAEQKMACAKRRSAGGR